MDVVLKKSYNCFEEYQVGHYVYIKNYQVIGTSKEPLANLKILITISKIQLVTI